MNTSTECARTLVDELVRCGVQEAVLSPGSRSAPLAMALHDADAQARLRLHVRVDERAAGFLALGLAKGSRRPVPVVTTSGSAVANLHPAVLEASHAGVALVVLTADRPAALRGTGANQTTEQAGLFGSAVRLAADVPAPAGAALRALVCRAVAAASGVRTHSPGPVHLNVQLADPLVPDPADDPSQWPAGRPGGAPWTRVEPEPTSDVEPVLLRQGPRTVVVAGDAAGAARASDRRAGQLAVAGRAVLRVAHRNPSDRHLPAAACRRAPRRSHRARGGDRSPDVVPTVNALLARPDVQVVAVGPEPRWTDPGHRVSWAVRAARADEAGAEPDWLDAWRIADRDATAAIDAELAAMPALAPQTVARAVSRAVPPGGLLVIGSSNPIRDLDLMAVSTGVGERRMVMANRGLSGIDGVVSTAIGVALARRPTRALAYVGDLTFLHDTNALLIGPTSPALT
jgi:2-succinyl-5-enolpyruvyl-6-hydroxy-3-cyclohexene-1-carboxylate synthase